MGVHLRLWIGPEQVTHGTWREEKEGVKTCIFSNMKGTFLK